MSEVKVTLSKDPKIRKMQLAALELGKNIEAKRKALEEETERKWEEEQERNQTVRDAEEVFGVKATPMTQRDREISEEMKKTGQLVMVTS